MEGCFARTRSTEDSMTPMQKADLIVTIHFLFVAFVLLAVPLILLGGALGWGWVRNFTFRAIHLFCIAIVAGEGLAATAWSWWDADAAWNEEEGHWKIECPLTTWERDYRRTYSTKETGGQILRDVENASWIGRRANRFLFYDNPSKYFWIGHLVFLVLVILTLAVVPPRWPWRRRDALVPAGEV
jgi:hypothetical protein